MKRNRLLRAALLLPLLALASESGAEVCPVSAASVVAEAIQQGFRFSAARTSGAGSCRLSNDSRSVTGVAGPSPVTCRGEFFTSRSLASGWRFGQRQFVGGQFEFDDPGDSIAIVFEVPTGGSGSRTLSLITLVGPDCDLWRDAFSHGAAPNAPASAANQRTSAPH